MEKTLRFIIADSQGFAKATCTDWKKDIKITDGKSLVIVHYSLLRKWWCFRPLLWTLFRLNWANSLVRTTVIIKPETKLALYVWSSWCATRDRTSCSCCYVTSSGTRLTNKRCEDETNWESHCCGGNNIKGKSKEPTCNVVQQFKIISSTVASGSRACFQILIWPSSSHMPRLNLMILLLKQDMVS